MAAALFVAGAGAVAGSLVSPDTPLWPSSAFESAAWPWAAAALSGLSALSAIGIGLFVLHMLDRVTAAWTRRSWLAGTVVVALITGLVAVKAGDAGAALAEGVAAGIVATGVVYYLLRFDARALPGYLVTAAPRSTQRRTPRVTGTRARMDGIRAARRGEHRRRRRGDALPHDARSRRGMTRAVTRAHGALRHYGIGCRGARDTAPCAAALPWVSRASRTASARL